MASLSLAVACGRIGFDDEPVVPSGPSGCGLRDLAVGATTSCAITESGGLWCWGGVVAANVTSPRPIALPEPAIKVVLGHDFACAVLESGKLRCLGLNQRGQLGNGTRDSVSGLSAPVGDASYLDVSAERDFMCAVTSLGVLECWGARWGLLNPAGAADVVDVLEPKPVPVPGDPRFSSVTTSSTAVCADTVDGARFCWGSLLLQQTTTTPVTTMTPTQVGETAPVRLSRTTACLLEDGTVRCIGAARYGELGDGSIESTSRGRGQLPLEGVRALAASGRSYCATTKTGEVWCWGSNRSGEVGTGDLSVQPTPTRVAIPAAVRVAAKFNHVCAETTDGVYCWGGDRTGALGQSETSIDRVGTLVAGLPAESFAQVAVVETTGGGCARTMSGDVWCWGQNFYGLTGDSGRRSSPVASRIALPFAAVDVVGTADFACARSATKVACWGRNNAGQLGQPTTSEVQATPLVVPNLPASATLTRMTASVQNVCLLANNVPYCWGRSGMEPRTATVVAGLGASIDITGRPADPATVGHQCALDTAGRARCWGQNRFGELGRGTVGGSDFTKALVVGGGTYSQIATSIGYSRTCAIPTGGIAAIDCWGYFFSGNASAPVRIALTAVPLRLEASADRMCAVFADDTRDCIGSAANGDFGDGANTAVTAFRHFPQVSRWRSFGSRNSCAIEGTAVRCVGSTRHGVMNVPPGATPRRVELSCR